LFGAAPSIALATLALTVMKEGKQYAAIEGRSMILGAVALFAYSLTLSYVLVRLRISALSASMVLLFLWMFVASGLWYVVLN
jgi:hypothetical protein